MNSHQDVIIEQLVVGADLLVDLVHILFHNTRDRLIIGVGGLAGLEEDVGVLSRTSLTWVIRIKSMVTECSDCIHICHILQIFIIPCFNLLNLVRCTESIEEVDEWKFSF